MPTNRSSALTDAMEKYPNVREAIRKLEETKAEIRGSLMTLQERRNFTLDKLVEVASDKDDTARVRALELIGKTANMFIDQVNHKVTSVGNSEDIRSEITKLLREISGRSERVIDGERIDSLLSSPLSEASKPVTVNATTVPDVSVSTHSPSVNTEPSQSTKGKTQWKAV